jgi:lysophospholipase L1-like esterase
MSSRALLVVAILTALLFGITSTRASNAADTMPKPAVTLKDLPPVVVVLDLSGSMNDDDGTGLIKLTGAKRAVDDVLRSIPSSQPFGLWTYPGGADDCESGGFAITPARITDLTGTIAKADALTADGGTPTGPALQSASVALSSEGTKAATLVLVSDGESNCGDNPCSIAKKLVAKGFDVTIHTVGFRVSERGRGELNCVASATGGTYVDVDNSAELNRTLQDLTRAKLRVQTASQSNPLDYWGRVTVTVSNQSAVTASDTQILLKLTGNAPSNVNTLLRVGNLLPGTSVSRTWDIGSRFGSPATGPAPTAGEKRAGQKFAVDAWANNANRVSAHGVVGGSGSDSGRVTLKSNFGSLLRRPLDAGHPIVILGDSYSAGEGTFDYVTPPDGVSTACHRSDKTYLTPQLDAGDVVNLACSGAVSWDYYYSGKAGTPPQLRQLADLKQAPGAVMMTLGGNDIGFAKIVEQCVRQRCDIDMKQIASWEAAADSLRTWLAPVYEDVWITINLPERRGQRDGAYAPVAVLAYPQVTHATKYGACGRVAGVKDTLGSGEVRVANDLLAHLNAALKAAVADARDAGYEIYFVPDTADAMLPNHTLCDVDNYINDVLLVPFASRPESVHPNVSGYAAETGAIAGWTVTATPTAPDTSSMGPNASKVTGTPWSLLPLGTPTIDLSGQGTVDGSLLNGEPVLIQGAGYEPTTPVIITIHSAPAVLGTLVADENGNIRGRLHLPPMIELGKHEIVTSGTSRDGTFREEHVAVTVLAQPPLWTQLALLGSGLLLLLAITFLALCWKSSTRGPRAATQI